MPNENQQQGNQQQGSQKRGQEQGGGSHKQSTPRHDQGGMNQPSQQPGQNPSRKQQSSMDDDEE
jgi:hypothetical protein